MNAQTKPATTAPTTADDARQMLDGFARIMDALLDAVRQETALVRAGKLRDATELEAVKADLARDYNALAASIKQNMAGLKKLAPAAVAALGKRHDEFQALLQINLTVLATAHAVSESIIRGVSGELARKQSPETYGATGRANQPGPRAGQPLTICRTL